MHSGRIPTVQALKPGLRAAAVAAADCHTSKRRCHSCRWPSNPALGSSTWAGLTWPHQRRKACRNRRRKRQARHGHCRRVAGPGGGLGRRGRRRRRQPACRAPAGHVLSQCAEAAAQSNPLIKEPCHQMPSEEAHNSSLERRLLQSVQRGLGQLVEVRVLDAHLQVGNIQIMWAAGTAASKCSEVAARGSAHTQRPSATSGCN